MEWNAVEWSGMEWRGAPNRARILYGLKLSTRMLKAYAWVITTMSLRRVSSTGGPLISPIWRCPPYEGQPWSLTFKCRHRLGLCVGTRTTLYQYLQQHLPESLHLMSPLHDYACNEYSNHIKEGGAIIYLEKAHIFFGIPKVTQPAAHTHTHTRTQTHRRTHKHTRSLARSLIHSQIHIHAHTHTHTHKHTHTHTHTHTNTYTYTHTYSLKPCHVRRPAPSRLQAPLMSARHIWTVSESSSAHNPNCCRHSLAVARFDWWLNLLELQKKLYVKPVNSVNSNAGTA